MTTAIDGLLERARRSEGAGEWDAAGQSYARAWRTAAAERALTPMLTALRGEGRAEMCRGGEEHAEELFELSLELARINGLEREVARALNNLAVLRFRQRRWDEAVALYEETLGLARETGDSELVAMASQNLGVVMNITGRFREARTLYLESVASVLRTGSPEQALIAYNELGVVACDLGEWMEAALYLDRGIEIAQRVHAPRHLATLCANRAYAALRAHNTTRATGMLERAAELAERGGFDETCIDVRRLRATHARLEGRLPEAERLALEALARADPETWPLERGAVLEEIGAIRTAQGREFLAASALREARDVYRRIGARGYAARVERRLERLLEAPAGAPAEAPAPDLAGPHGLTADG